VDVDCKELKAKVELVLPMECETRSCDLTEESMKSLLEATLHKVPLLELLVVYNESGDFDQTALALEHLRLVKPLKVVFFFIFYFPFQRSSIKTAQLGLCCVFACFYHPHSPCENECMRENTKQLASTVLCSFACACA